MSAKRREGLPRLEIYTDGGCKPNPGAGGWGAVILRERKTLRELAGGEARTTNNRMEMTAAIEALRWIRGSHEVTLVTDSTYLKNGITRWIAGWRRRGWRTQDGGAVANRDLWEALDQELQRHRVRWRWTRGHSGNRGNERADQLATQARRKQKRGGKRPVAEAPAPEEVATPEDAVALELYCAASCNARSGDGAWGVVAQEERGRRTRSGADTGTTANRMYLLAVIEALRALDAPTAVAVHTFSDYVKDGATRWLADWRRRGWRTASGGAVRNQDLWRELAPLLARHRVSWPPQDRRQPSEPMRAAQAAARAAPRSVERHEQGLLFD